MKAIQKLWLYILMAAFLAVNFSCSGCSCSKSDITTIQMVEQPSFAVVGGTSYDITMSCATDGATIKYTTDLSNPKTSGTGYTGTAVTIDLLMVIKAYASKEGMKDSCVAEYRVPMFNVKRFVKFDTAGSTADSEGNGYGGVDHYYTNEYDCNGLMVKAVWYNGPGEDEKWYTEDDTISSFKIFTYTPGKVTKETTYTAAGADGEWLTSDDTIDNYVNYTYSVDNLTEKRKFSNSDVLMSYTTYTYNGANCEREIGYTAGDAVEYYIDYTYSGSLLAREVKYSGAGTNGVWFNADDVPAYYIDHTYNISDLVQSRRYNGPGVDTLWFGAGTEEVDNVTELYDTRSYTDSVESCESYVYDSGTKTRVNNYLLYGTDDASLDSYTTYSYNESDFVDRETKYTGGEVEYYYVYNYDGSNNLETKDKYNSSNERVSYYEYTYNSDLVVQVVEKVRPGAASKNVSWNITVTAGTESGGYYTVSGVNYDTSGEPIGSLADESLDNSDFLAMLREKLTAIAGNISYDDTGTTINGLNGGSCVITIAASNSPLGISATFKFNNYNDGDVTIKGIVTKKVTGSIDPDGLIPASFSGEFTGSLTVTDANPTFTDGDFIENSYTLYTWNGSLLDQTDTYTDPGIDGAWFTGSDDTLGSYITYQYDLSDNLITENWYSADATLLYFYSYLYESGNIAKKVKHLDLGILKNEFNEDGADNIWLGIAKDDILSYSLFEYTVPEE